MTPEGLYNAYRAEINRLTRETMVPWYQAHPQFRAAWTAAANAAGLQPIPYSENDMRRFQESGRQAAKVACEKEYQASIQIQVREVQEYRNWAQVSEREIKTSKAKADALAIQVRELQDKIAKLTERLKIRPTRPTVQAGSFRRLRCVRSRLEAGDIFRSVSDADAPAQIITETEEDRFAVRVALESADEQFVFVPSRVTGYAPRRQYQKTERWHAVRDASAAQV